MGRYRFTIERSEDGADRELNVDLVSNFNLKFERESGEEYVRVSPGGVVKIEDKRDYDWLMIYENDPVLRCSKFLFHLDIYCNGKYERYDTYKFSLNNAKVCLDTCSIEISLRNNDLYECLADGDEVRNVLETGDLPEKTIDAYPNFNNLEFYITASTDGTCNGTSNKPPVDTSSWGIFGCSTGTIGNAGTGCPPLFGKIWARKKIKSSCVAGSPLALPPGGILISNDCSIDGTYTYAQPYTGSVGSYSFSNTGGSGLPFLYSSHTDLGHVCVSDPVVTDPYLFTNDYTITTSCQQPSPYPPIDESLKYCFYVDYVALETQTPKTIYDRGRCLLDVLLWLAQESCPDISCIKSLFMNKNVNDAGAINYVTGSNNKLDDLILLEKSDTVTPGSTEKATILNLSFKDLYDTLKNLLNVRYTIDKDNCLVIEHISKLKGDQAITLDLTDPDALEGFCCYEYDTLNIPSRETWEMQDGSGLDFLGQPIKYELSDGTLNPCVTADEEKIDLTELTTDLEHIQNTPTAEQSLDGFVILAGEPDGLGGRKVITENGELTNTNILNGHLSLANVHKNYFCHDRKLATGNLNTQYVTFCSETKKKKGQEFAIKLCCESLFNFDPNGLVRTKFGDGEIEDGTYDLINQELTLNLIY